MGLLMILTALFGLLALVGAVYALYYREDSIKWRYSYLNVAGALREVSAKLKRAEALLEEYGRHQAKAAIESAFKRGR